MFKIPEAVTQHPGKHDRRKYVSLAALLLVVVWFPESAHVSGQVTKKPAGASPAPISDEQITNAVSRELLTSDQVDSHRIDVVTKEGIVELSGSVGNLLAKRHAEREAETIKGVRAVINRIQVRSQDLTDRQIGNNVLTALAMDPATDTWEIRVEVENGIATLQGTVDSYAEFDLAEDVAATARGVMGIENELEVAYDTTRRDPEIAKDVEGRLAASAWIDDGLIDVQVEGGNVRLTGSVGSAAEKSQARRKAWVAGVRMVDAEGLEIRWDLRNEMQRESGYVNLDDTKIEGAILDAFSYDPRVAPFDISVRVVQGTVTLTGVVDNLRAKWAAEDDARNTKGVWRVDNLVRVRSAHQPSDKEILATVRAVLDEDVLIDPDGIAVKVDNGHVFLRGTVYSELERKRAEGAASGVAGAVAITNRLRVDDNDVPVDDDLELKAKIDAQIVWSPYLEPEQVDVRVVDGVATLTGTVDNWTQWGAARDNALEAGARRVVNQLKVKQRR